MPVTAGNSQWAGNHHFKSYILTRELCWWSNFVFLLVQEICTADTFLSKITSQRDSTRSILGRMTLLVSSIQEQRTRSSFPFQLFCWNLRMVSRFVKDIALLSILAELPMPLSPKLTNWCTGILLWCKCNSLSSPSSEISFFPYSSFYMLSWCKEVLHTWPIFSVPWFQKLYDQGASKFWIHNTGPLGCLPQNIALFGKDPSQLDELHCVAKHNRAAKLFNLQLTNIACFVCCRLLSLADGWVIIYLLQSITHPS